MFQATTEITLQAALPAVSIFCCYGAPHIVRSITNRPVSGARILASVPMAIFQPGNLLTLALFHRLRGRDQEIQYGGGGAISRM